MAEMRVTLGDLNATAHIADWGKYDLKTEYAVGWQSRRGNRSSKVHLLRIERVVADREPEKGTYKLGDIFSAQAACNGNGQHTGRVVSTLDTDAITCQKCRLHPALCR